MKLLISKSITLALCGGIVTLTLMAGLAISEDQECRQVMQAPRRDSMFENPTIKHPQTGVFYRLDWCYNWAVACGQDAADAFCRAQSYAKAKEFEMDANIGNHTPTLVMGDQRLCTKSFCNGFSYITCSD